jgi:hypothetical protein
VSLPRSNLAIKISQRFNFHASIDNAQLEAMQIICFPKISPASAKFRWFNAGTNNGASRIDIDIYVSNY